MDADSSSLAAAALYDMKNEQLQLANAVLHQTSSNENKKQGTSVSTTTDQSVATTTEGHHFGEGGK